MKTSKTIVKILTLLSLIFGILSLLWLIYDYVLYNELKNTMLVTTDLGKLEVFGQFVWLSYLFFFCYHILANGTLILQSRYFRKIRAINVLALMLGVVSFICIFGDWAIMGDISKEYKMGWDTSGEWKILHIFLGIHMVYIILITGISAVMVWKRKELDKGKAVEQKDEMVFTLAQYVGIACGLFGFAYTVMGLIISQKFDMSGQSAVYHMVSTTVLILVPYGIIILYWLILKLRERMGDWYDEKQWRDVTRAGFTTLLVTLPTLGLFFLLVSVRQMSNSATLLWFPFTLFVVLFLFSLFTLINYRHS